MEKVIQDLDIDIVMIAVPHEAALGILEKCIALGVRGFINLSSGKLKCDKKDVHIKEINIE
jgi:NADH/NAD ratio-sensing transcriptional regulator Rex